MKLKNSVQRKIYQHFYNYLFFCNFWSLLPIVNVKRSMLLNNDRDFNDKICNYWSNSHNLIKWNENTKSVCNTLPLFFFLKHLNHKPRNILFLHHFFPCAWYILFFFHLWHIYLMVISWQAICFVRWQKKRKKWCKNEIFLGLSPTTTKGNSVTLPQQSDYYSSIFFPHNFSFQAHH